MYKSIKLKNISKTIGSGITPLRSNPKFWDNGTISWLKTEQLGEHKIYETTEKITQYAVDNTSVKVFPKNTLSIAMYGEGRTRGNVSILKSEMTTNQACCNIVIDNKKADFEYVYYFLKTQYLNLRSLSSGVRKNLNSNDIKEFEIRLPEDILTQQKIAKVLSDLDAKIELNTKINAELEAMAKTLYDYWFVQFDFPFVTSSGVEKPYKTSGGKMVWNEELKREIPEGWEVKTIDEYAEVKKGELITAKDSEEGEIKVVAAGVSYSYNHSKANRKINTITISGSGANAGFINFWREPIFASDCITVRGNTDTETLMLLQYLKFIQVHILSQATGSAQPHVYPSDIKRLNYIIPPKELIENFGIITIPMNDKIANNLKQNQQLASLRDWLLPMLMNGQVRVGEENENIEEKKKSILNSIDKFKGYSSKEENSGMVAEDKEEYKAL